ncbi:MAG: sugar ABC transporter permease [Chloroflexi bacterium]|nr:sugar ABC transporter permease [Chloroflexota bacterium]
MSETQLFSVAPQHTVALRGSKSRSPWGCRIGSPPLSAPIKKDATIWQKRPLVSAPAVARQQTLASKRIQEIIAGYGFVGPAFLVLFVFLILPMIAAVYFSLTDWNGITPLTRSDAYEVTGLENYERLMLRDGTRQTAFFTSLKIPSISSSAWCPPRPFWRWCWPSSSTSAG